MSERFYYGVTCWVAINTNFLLLLLLLLLLLFNDALNTYQLCLGRKYEKHQLRSDGRLHHWATAGETVTQKNTKKQQPHNQLASGAVFCRDL